MEVGVDQKILSKKKKISVASCRSTKTSTEKKERVQLFLQLAAYKFIFAYNLFEILGAQELCYSVRYPKRGFPRGPDVHPVNRKQDSLSTATSRTQH